MNLNLAKDGSLNFDANIGRRNVAVFPKVVKPGEWNRLMLVYDGKVVRLYNNGTLVERREYPGKLSQSRYLPLIIGADNTYGANGFSNHLPMQLREFSIAPFLPEAEPPK